MHLTLVVNVWECKSGVLWPEEQSVWPKSELVRLLELTGVTGKVEGDHDRLVNLLLSRLTLQKPVLYAIAIETASDSSVLLDAGKSQVRNGTWQEDFDMQKRRVERGRGCEEIWGVFYDHIIRGRPFEIDIPSTGELVRREMRKLEELRARTPCETELAEATKIVNSSQLTLTAAREELGRVKASWRKAQQEIIQKDAQIAELRREAKTPESKV